MSTVPSPSPGTPMPVEIPQIDVPPEQAPPPEIDEPQFEPAIPVRDPGVTTPARASWSLCRGRGVPGESGYSSAISPKASQFLILVNIIYIVECHGLRREP